MGKSKPAPSEPVDPILKTLDLRLKKLDWWIKFFGIAGAVLGLAVTLATAWNGYSLWVEGRRVQMSLELRTQVLPNGKLHVDAVLKNDSKREVNLAMIGVRLWKADWTEGDSVANKPDLLLYSDVRVSDCPQQMCGQSTDRTQLIELSHPVALASGETDRVALGTYAIPPGEFQSGIWIEGQAYTREYDRGTCAVTRPPPVKGAFPFFCETGRAGDIRCDVDAECKFATDSHFVASVNHQP